MARISIEEAGGRNVVALLDAIAGSEIDAWTLAHSDDGYNVLVGSHGSIVRNGQTIPPNLLTFPSYTTHPDILNSALNSTAAGRYQLLFRWYQPYAKLLNLSDFSPISQDRIAIQQLKERGSIRLIQNGNLGAALAQASNIWASLPGSPYGQHTNTVAYLTSLYKAAGGIINVAA
ncbi:glycoside hydrolase family 24 protein [Burkholderia pyrrocinia]|uniref:glycoside hydrolase family 24 protein n=1 Tax=Burkholderia pyrrocinia TaxID=60550 RepID=UPI00158DC2CD|nr:glycoside hydrolase family 104 protein [Burkholderia pyrrocinia]